MFSFKTTKFIHLFSTWIVEKRTVKTKWFNSCCPDVDAAFSQASEVAEGKKQHKITSKMISEDFIYILFKLKSSLELNLKH